MKKVGIVTFHRAVNYGAVLQCYALSTYLKSHGCDTEIIDYYSKPVYDIYNILNFRSGGIKQYIRFLVLPFRSKKLLNRSNLFDKFRKKYLSLSESLNNKKDFIKYVSKYDYLVCGSDQVWNKDITLADRSIYDLSCIDDKNIKKVSYAASVGNDNINKDEKEYLDNLVKKFNYVSVREKSLKEKLGNNVVNVFDPVFLFDKKEWNKLCENEKKEDFVFVFPLQNNDDIDKIVDELNKNYNYKIYIYGKFGLKKYSKGKIEYIFDISPNEFLTLIRDAKMVVTNSFHGLSLSVILNKQFISVLHTSRSSRQIDVLKELNLSDRIYNNNLVELINNEIDYKKVNSIISLKRKESTDFIDKAIINDKN